MKYQTMFDYLDSQEFEESFKSKAPVVKTEEVKQMPETSAIQTFLNKSNDDATNKAEKEEVKGPAYDSPSKEGKDLKKIEEKPVEATVVEEAKA